MTRKQNLAKLVAVSVLVAFVAPAALATGGGGGQPGPLNILLTNDDGWDSPGIQILRGTLLAHGHNVTIVAPLDQQSGKGGAINTDVGGTVDVLEQAPGVWSVDSTPSDAVRVGLSAVLADDPPDLIVSGMNFGQNLAQTGTQASGTVNAALAGLHAGIPAIAVSVGLDFSEARETPIPFPSTFAAFGPAADFTARLIERLQVSARRGDLLPYRTMLNVNVPVPYDEIVGVRNTALAQDGNFKFVYQDLFGAIAAGGGPVLLNVEFPPGPDPVRNSDTDAYRDGMISVGLLNGDMSAPVVQRFFTALRVHGIQP